MFDFLASLARDKVFPEAGVCAMAKGKQGVVSEVEQPGPRRLACLWEEVPQQWMRMLAAARAQGSHFGCVCCIKVL